MEPKPHEARTHRWLPTVHKTAQMLALVEVQKRYCFKWMIRRRDGMDLPVEITSAALLMGRKSIHIIISRDISEDTRLGRKNQCRGRLVGPQWGHVSTVV
jgi:hypothetical protein